MTNPDLAREIEKLLPCEKMESRSVGATIDYYCGRDGWVCRTCRLRPAILAYVQRKLDEAKADGELLEKCAALRDVSVSHRIGGAVYFERAPTLVDALRKLVESDS